MGLELVTQLYTNIDGKDEDQEIIPFIQSIQACHQTRHKFLLPFIQVLTGLDAWIVQRINSRAGGQLQGTLPPLMHKQAL